MGKGRLLRKDLEIQAQEISNNCDRVDIEVKKHKNAVSVTVKNKVENSEKQFVGDIEECFIFLSGVGALAY